MLYRVITLKLVIPDGRVLVGELNYLMANCSMMFIKPQGELHERAKHDNNDWKKK